MIAHVRGPLAAVGADYAVIEAGGVGYRCLISNSTRSRLPALGQEAILFTSLQVREDSMTLYGFAAAEEYDLFELLLKVEGIGPKVALSVLSATSPTQFRRAVAFEDLAALTRIPGIGKKTAQRMVLELRDKLGSLEQPGGAITAIPLPGGMPAGGASVAPDPYAEAMEALVALGYSRTDAGSALEKAKREAGEASKPETLVRLGLKYLFRG